MIDGVAYGRRHVHVHIRVVDKM